ncbi:MAG: ubiquinol-cytochrome c reductase iron-sulfur subunit [Chloroflexota bacterium]|nr:MAG: ubiquinol-cytochrome c reductase iron-sulfur subunit [Chloroflexota bacterium]
MEPYANHPRMSRRSFLAAVMGGFSALVATVLGVPAVVFGLSPALKQTKKETWVQVGLPGDFKTGQPQMAEFTIFRKDGWLEESVSKSVWVVRTGDADFAVYNPRCTHLGCIVSWRPEETAFFSPCHGGVFALTGEVLAGPPPRSLDKLDWKVDGGKLVVNFKDFRLGVPEKVEV